MRRAAMIACAFAAAVGAPRAAAAFHGGQSFAVSANEGGGGGIFFTSSPRFRHYDCSICHIDPPHQMSLEVSSLPADLFEQGSWEPGQSYELTVRMIGETRGLDSASNVNTFSAEWVDAAGNSTGRLEAPNDEVATFDDGRVLAARGSDRVTQWQFRFVAPAAGTGPISLHLAAVDGDGAGNQSARTVDAYGDDVAVFAATLCERGGACEPADGAPSDERPDSAATTGCAIGAAPGASWAPWAIGGLPLLAARRRRARRPPARR